MNKAIFLDRDGTINVDKHYMYKIEDFELLPGVIEALQMLQEAGYLLIVITNQSGIARGIFTEEDYNILTDYMLEIFSKYNIEIKEVLYCPHLPDAKVTTYRCECECRKPGLELFERAQRKWNIDLSRSFAIGDKMRDCAICQKTECRGFIIEENRFNVDSNKYMITNNVEFVGSLYEAAKIICEIQNKNC